MSIIRSTSRTVGLAAALTFGASVGLATGAAQAADGYSIYSKKATFQEVVDDLNDAIIKRGYVVDYTGEINAMLARTAKDTGSVTAGGRTTPYKNAKFVQFCPAKLTHESVNMSPFGIANCPIAIFVFETAVEPGKIHLGYRHPIKSSSRKVNEVNRKITGVLADIAKDTMK